MRVIFFFMRASLHRCTEMGDRAFVVVWNKEVLFVGGDVKTGTSGRVGILLDNAVSGRFTHAGLTAGGIVT